jgi:hypothetical protein
MATEQEQVETTEEQSEETSEELEALSEEETVAKVSELLNEQEETTEEQPEEVEAEAETEETPEEVEAPVATVDEEFVKAYPATKAYIGKPVTELGKGYQSVVKEFYETRKENSELKKKLAEVSIPKLEDEPDPVEKPEEHKKWTEEREEAIRQDERNKLKDQPQEINYMAELSKNLPSDVDVNKVVEGWSNANAYRLYDELGELMPEVQLLYRNKPHLLAQEITEYYNLTTKADKTDAQIKKAAHTKSKEDFKKARRTKKTMPGSEVNVIERATETNETDRMLSNILEIVKED